ncbi:M10 family metallopeptidase C-terminal domain-containing protein [Thalassococcus sp. BH17M4-6]|uniref:M10 family metallopeptidase C-terminal domain-containing protein n=1 Tax=Thalassococcus sp. BH17M4-6 TaxID=3413148 RepID=UPI003BEE5F7C
MAGIGATDTATTTEIQNNPFLSGLAFLYGSGFETWNSTSLTFTMNVGDNDPNGNPVGTWTTALTDAINYAHAHIEAVSNVTFTEVPDAVNGTDGADIDYWYYNSSSYLGYSYGVGGSGVYINERFVRVDGPGSSNGLEPGGYDYITVIHELLHNMGLSHPFDRYASFPGVDNSADTGDFALNQNVYTVMSYSDINQVDANGVPTTSNNLTDATRDHGFTTMGAFDIAMLQTLYGANMSTATGDDVYVLPTVNTTGTFFQALWDAGGIDEIRHDGTAGAIIDLRAATLDLADGMLAGGMLSRVPGIYGGFTIANGVVIENATGGLGDDTITGNDAANVLDGRAGDDTLMGGANDDTLRLSMSVAGDIDFLDGEGDTDTADFSGFNSAVWVDLAYTVGLEAWTRDTGSARPGQPGTWREIADLANIENVTATGFDDMLIGDGGSNVLRGLGGNDLILLTEADAGAVDTLDGGEDTDTVDFSRFGAAVWVDLAYTAGLEAWTRDTTSALPGVGPWREIAALESIENVTGSAFDDWLKGDGESNLIRGLAGDDVLALSEAPTDADFSPVDILDGGADTDTADFSGFGSAVWIDLDYGTSPEVWTRDTADAAPGIGPWRVIADLKNIENLTGTAYNDWLIGNGGSNVIRGLAGDDVLALAEANVGAIDTLDGGADTDTADFSDFNAAVWVDLAYTAGLEAWTRDTGSALPGVGPWREIADLEDIENVTGTDFDDWLAGDDGNNVLRGGDGSDVLTGRGGVDEFIFDFASGGTAQTATITDFDLGTDVLTVNGQSEDAFYASSTFVSMTDGGGPDTTITLSTGDSLILEDVTVAEIEAHYASV